MTAVDRPDNGQGAFCACHRANPCPADDGDARELPSVADSQQQCDIAEVLHADGTLVWGVALVKAQQIVGLLASGRAGAGEQQQTEGATRPWRVGSHYGIHVYKGGDPVATFLRPENAREAVDAVNAQIAARAGAGEQQREQIARWLWKRDGWTEQQFDAAGPETRGWWREDAAELLALLGGPQPDGEVRQHRMDADCWCQPVQADNGAWDHNDGPTAPEPATPAPNA